LVKRHIGRFFGEGLLHAGTADVVGKLGPQGPIACDGKTGLADDVLGRGCWQLISRTDVRTVLSRRHLALLESLDTAWVALDLITDIEGGYQRYLEEHGLQAVLVRPDFYVFGACETDAEITDMLDSLHVQLNH